MTSREQLEAYIEEKYLSKRNGGETRMPQESKNRIMGILLRLYMDMKLPDECRLQIKNSMDEIESLLLNQ